MLQCGRKWSKDIERAAFKTSHLRIANFSILRDKFSGFFKKESIIEEKATSDTVPETTLNASTILNIRATTANRMELQQLITLIHDFLHNHHKDQSAWNQTLTRLENLFQNPSPTSSVTLQWQEFLSTKLSAHHLITLISHLTHFEKYKQLTIHPDIISSISQVFNNTTLNTSTLLINASNCLVTLYKHTSSIAARPSVLQEMGTIRQGPHPMRKEALVLHSCVVSMLSHVHSSVRRQMPCLLIEGRFSTILSVLSQAEFSEKTLHSLMIIFPLYLKSLSPLSPLSPLLSSPLDSSSPVTTQETAGEKMFLKRVHSREIAPLIRLHARMKVKDEFLLSTMVSVLAAPSKIFSLKQSQYYFDALNALNEFNYLSYRTFPSLFTLLKKAYSCAAPSWTLEDVLLVSSCWKSSSFMKAFELENEKKFRETQIQILNSQLKFNKQKIIKSKLHLRLLLKSCLNLRDKELCNALTNEILLPAWNDLDIKSDAETLYYLLKLQCFMSLPEEIMKQNNEAFRLLFQGDIIGEGRGEIINRVLHLTPHFSLETCCELFKEELIAENCQKLLELSLGNLMRYQNIPTGIINLMQCEQKSKLFYENHQIKIDAEKIAETLTTFLLNEFQTVGEGVRGEEGKLRREIEHKENLPELIKKTEKREEVILELLFSSLPYLFAYANDPNTLFDILMKREINATTSSNCLKRLRTSLASMSLVLDDEKFDEVRKLVVKFVKSSTKDLFLMPSQTLDAILFTKSVDINNSPESDIQNFHKNLTHLISVCTSPPSLADLSPSLSLAQKKFETNDRKAIQTLTLLSRERSANAINYGEWATSLEKDLQKCENLMADYNDASLRNLKVSINNYLHQISVQKESIKKSYPAEKQIHWRVRRVLKETVIPKHCELYYHEHPKSDTPFKAHQSHIHDGTF